VEIGGIAFVMNVREMNATMARLGSGERYVPDIQGGGFNQLGVGNRENGGGKNGSGDEFSSAEHPWLDPRGLHLA
jgi:hypothetical protein